MVKFEMLPHTADAKFRAYGKTVEEAFSNSAYALLNIFTTDIILKVISKEIKCDGLDLKSLLYNFLEKIIYFVDADEFLLSEIKEIKIEKKHGLFILEAKAIGDDIGKYEIETAVKASTYAEMEIIENKDGFVIQAVVDI